MRNAFLTNDVLLYMISGENAMEIHVFLVFRWIISYGAHPKCGGKHQPDQAVHKSQNDTVNTN